MIKIIPYGQRTLTRKSLAKIWNLFPNEEFCMAGITRDLDVLRKVNMIAYYYTLRGKDFSVEIDPVKYTFELNKLVKIGVKKFYFPWYGIVRGLFFSSTSVLEQALWLVENHEDIEVTIIYEPIYDDIYHPPDFDEIETSIVYLGKFVNSKTRLHGRFRRPHPWYGIPRIKKIEELEKLSLQQGNFDIEDACGCITIASNTNIYCCPFCERKRKKKLFGNADRDKYVIGTVGRGIFREIKCGECKVFPNAKKGQFQYINRGVK